MRAYGRFALAASAAMLAVGCSKPAGGSASTAPAAAGSAQAAVMVSVPFVGCAQDGQGGPQPAPTGPAKTLQLDAATADKLAYYSAGDAGGVLGPRGWSCFGIYGSDASILFIAPNPIQSSDAMSTDWSGLGGSMIQVGLHSGDTSGRFAVAKVIARVFPAHMAFARSVIAEGIEPAGDFPTGPFPGDAMTMKGDQVVEYRTPAGSEGLGTSASRLKPNGDPISGVAILRGQTPDLLFAAVRLPPDLASLAPTVVSQLEQDNGAAR